ncbi:MAG TPA: lamin tail domain-containing protein, partial [Flavisolibacter sp.]|nr:lamin tail domain-containing protein [Flavisolibacter sp.]
NVSSAPFNLSGWKISDATSTATIITNFILQPDSIAVICSNGNVAAFSVFGRTIGVSSFPSLDNEGDLILLRSPEGKTIHALNYTIDWYQNEVKRDGGWSLEMIDTRNPCSGMSNWKASTDASGGTPGKKNSVDGVNTDATPPQLIRTYSLDDVTLVALFDEPLDSTSASSASNYSLTNNMAIASATPQAPLFNSVMLKLSTPLQKQTSYALVVNNVKDCKGNSIGVYNKAKAGLAEETLSNDVVINEILFNPRPNAFDYVEIYNRSNKIVDASKLYIANKNAAGVLASIKKLSETPFYIFPDDYIVVTEDAASLKHEYLVHNPQNVLVLSSLPSFPDNKGTVAITNSQGNIVDEVSYSEKWHFALISDAEGVALERIDPNDSSQKQSNWHSAASTAGYGTPTYKNSQYKQTSSVNAIIEVSPKVFSPDNDGRDDIATISYSVTGPGYIANITIFDANGRLVRYLIKNALLGLKGSWNWDGLNENGQKPGIGTYIIYTEIFNLQGKKKQFKNTIVLARKLN